MLDPEKKVKVVFNECKSGDERWVGGGEVIWSNWIDPEKIGVVKIEIKEEKAV